MEDVGGAGDRIFPDALLFEGDLEEEAVEGLAGDVAVEVGGVGAEEGGGESGFAEHLFVGAGDPGLFGGAGDDGVEAFEEIGFAGAPEELGGGVVRAGEDGGGVGEGELADGLGEDGGGLGDGLLRGAVQGGDEIIGEPILTEQAEGAFDPSELVGHGDLDGEILEETVRFAEGCDGVLDALAQRLLEAGDDLFLGEGLGDEVGGVGGGPAAEPESIEPAGALREGGQDECQGEQVRCKALHNRRMVGHEDALTMHPAGSECKLAGPRLDRERPARPVSRHVNKPMKKLWMILVALTVVLTPRAEDTRLYEMRTYTAAPGKMEALHARFQQHACRLLERHGMVNIGYWVPVEEADGAANKLMFIVAHRDRETREAAWKALIADPEWQAAFKASEAGGRLVEKAEVRFLRATDYSPAIQPPGAGGPRVFELRTYVAAPGRLAALNARFRNHTLGLFEKHGIQNVAYWTVAEGEPGADDTLIYFIAHRNREAAKASFDAFRVDAAWLKARQESEERAGGSLTAPGGVTSVFMKTTPYSPIQ